MKKRLVLIMTAAMLLAGCGAAENEGTENTSAQEVQNETGAMQSEVETEVEETEEVASTEVVPEAVPEETPEVEVGYTYTDLDKTLYAKQSVNVRDIPSADGTKLGALSFAQEVHVTGQCNETSWYRIEYNGEVAYVSNNYLVETKPEVQTNQSASNGGGTQSGSWSDGYEMYVWYDMGEYFFMRVANVDEARQYLNQFPSTHWQTLKDRYPDREIVYGGTGPNCAVVSAVYMDPETGFPIWSADYLWD